MSDEEFIERSRSRSPIQQPIRQDEIPEDSSFESSSSDSDDSLDQDLDQENMEFDMQAEDSDEDIMTFTDYFDMLEDLSKKWLAIHLTHNVSLTATYEFWKLALIAMPKLMQMKNEQDIQRKTPQLVQLRRKIYKEMCPEIHMDFIYYNSQTQETINVSSNSTPVKQYQSDPNYIKQCEIARVKVKNGIPET